MKVCVTSRTRAGVPSGWAVVDGGGMRHEEAGRFLEYLEKIEYSPNTRRAYAYDLAAFLTYLNAVGLVLDDASNEVLAAFAHWLRSPSDAVLAGTDCAASLSRASTNRALAAVSSFYRFLGSGGPGSVGYQGFDRLRVSAATFKPKSVSVIDTVARAALQRNNQRLGPRLPAVPPQPRILTVQQVRKVVDACGDARERLLISLGVSTGLRLGQMLGLRHCDINTVEHSIAIVPRADSENGARTKSRSHHRIPISRELSRLYTTYMHTQYGFLDSEYVFVNLRGPKAGLAMTPSAVYAILRRLARQSGVTGWSMHTLRHTFVTMSQQAGIPIDVISSLVTHASVETTVRVYSHLDVEDLRSALIQCGAWEHQL